MTPNVLCAIVFALAGVQIAMLVAAIADAVQRRRLDTRIDAAIMANLEKIQAIIKSIKV